MARRRKKSRVAALSKSKEKETSPMLAEKSLPALPTDAIPQGAFSPDPGALGSMDSDTATELSPPPRTTHPQGSSSRSSSRRPPSPDHNDTEPTNKDSLTLPSSTYRSNRHSGLFQTPDPNGSDGDGFFIPLALDPTPPPAISSRPTGELRADVKSFKENKAPENNYFTVSRGSTRGQGDEKQGRGALQEQETSSQSLTPHIAFQEKGRQLAPEFTESPSDTLRKQTPPSKSGSAKGSPAIGNDELKVQHASSNSHTSNGKVQSTPEKFRLQEVPKSRKASASKSSSQSDTSPSVEMDTMKSVPNFGPRKDSGTSTAISETPKGLLSVERSSTPRSSQELRLREDIESRPSTDSATSSFTPSRGDSGVPSKAIARKEIPPGAIKSSLESKDTSSSSASSSDTPGVTPTINGKTISGPLLQSSSGDELIPPARANNRPVALQQKLGDTYMAPRTPPAPPPITSHKAGKASMSSGEPVSPKLPRWSGGGEFTMEEDMARILGADEGSQSILRRVSNVVRHGRNTSEASNSVRQGHGRSISETTRTTSSPRWPKSPITEDPNYPVGREISSPISIASPSADDPALLKRQLRNSEQRVAELERQFNSTSDLQNINKKLQEKRKTVSVLDSQAELMIRQIEVLAGFVEKAKDSKQPLDLEELEESAVKEFVQKIDRLKQSISAQVEQLLDERNELIDEKNQAIRDRDRALVEFEQLSAKNAQLADLNNDLTHQIQERFKAQTSNNIEIARFPANGLGIYNTHQKDKPNSIQIDDTSLRSSNTAVVASTNVYPQAMEQDPSMDPSTVVSAPHVVNIRKGQAKKFNWKKGGQTVAKGVSKGFKGAFAAVGQEKNTWQGQTGDSIGIPYNLTVAPVESPIHMGPNSLPRSNDPKGGFGLFKKSSTMPKVTSNGNLYTASAEHPTTLFGSELVERADYERRQIPSVVTRCIEEVELRGMDVEGIYRKTGGSGQVKIIQEGFEKNDDYDISDPSLDITAVTSVLKQYFRKLPTPLLTFDIYDRVIGALGKFVNLLH
jgi:Rho-type GTPase-activating protein 1/2